ncbi:hypothetical protein JCM8547_001539 [Rhodosporidiobolus lusitaniae]
MALSAEQDGAFSTLISMGFDPQDSQRAVLKYGSNLAAASDWILNGAPASPPATVDFDDIPPLVSAQGVVQPVHTEGEEDEALPHPSTIGAGGRKDSPPSYEEVSGGGKGGVEKILPAPYSQPDAKLIDLTDEPDSTAPSFVGPKLLTAPPSSPTARQSPQLGSGGDADLQRALEASKADAGVAGGGEGEDDLSKAMALSMATLGSADEETVGGVIDGIKPEDRVREDLSVPPTLRSLSPLQSSLSSYFQSLYALPSWRTAVLSWRAPTKTVYDPNATYEDCWRGDGGAAAGGLGMPMMLEGREEREQREMRLIALQRLFALMTLTRRSFLHITEVVRAFGIRESDFSKPGDAWVWRLREIHRELVEDLRVAAGEEASYLLTQGASEAEAQAYEKKAGRRFFVTGRAVKVDEHVGAPLAPAHPNDIQSDVAILIRLNPTNPSPQDLFAALDSQLVEPVPSSSASTPTTLHLLTATPSTLLLHLERHAPAITSLDSFGSGKSGRESKRLFRPHKKGEEEEETWLDRYHVKNRKWVAEARRMVGGLGEEKRGLEERRREVGWVKVKEGGEDVRVMVKRAVEVLRREEEREGEEEGLEGRRERQRKLREQWEKVGEELEGVLSSYDSSLTALDARIASLFTPDLSSPDAPAVHRIGPYKLCAILMHNGLNGRGSVWSVVRGADGRWWKIVDFLKEEVTLEQALDDPSGLMMDAGAQFLFYQKTDDDAEPVSVPAHLERIAHLDNHALLSSLPSHLSSTYSSAWSLPLLESLSAPAVPPLGAFEDDEDDAATVREVVLDFAAPEGDAGEASPIPEDILVDEVAAAAVAGGEGKKGEEEGAATPMSVDEEVLIEDEGPEHDAMRLRGGGGVEIEEEEEGASSSRGEGEEGEEDHDDHEEYGSDIDEDEVELGLLAPMPEDWDVDYAVGKVGGLPKWLDPRSPLGVEDVSCGNCGRAMGLLLQVNAPDDSRPYASARSLYVFACRGRECLSRYGPEKAVRVWRTQMPSPNEFYPHTDETIKKRGEAEVLLDKETQLGGKLGEKGRMEPFPEFDVQAEPEPYEESYLPDPAQPAAEKEEGTEDAAEPDTKTGVDRAFLAFQERIEREPKQVLRFYRLPGIEDPQPLWASATKISSEQVAPCELCRGQRKVEFQILSTLLPSLQDDNLDFDSLLVYTCVNHCAIPKREGGKTGWAGEVAFKQDFAAEGVRFGGLAQQLQRTAIAE